MGINSSMAGLVLVIRKGNPKYVKHVVPIWHSEIVVRWIIFSSDTLIGTGKDLLKFTFKPVEQGKTCTISFNHETYGVSTGRIIRVSSACCTIEKSPPKFWPRGWLIKVLLPASLITNWRRSSSSTNSKDPLVLLPSCTLKGLHVTPFRSTWVNSVLYPLYPFIKKPLCLRTSRITWCSILSKAFSKSNWY